MTGKCASVFGTCHTCDITLPGLKNLPMPIEFRADKKTHTAGIFRVAKFLVLARKLNTYRLINF